MAIDLDAARRYLVDTEFTVAVKVRYRAPELRVSAIRGAHSTGYGRSANASP
jgi:hypothetical protein